MKKRIFLFALALMPGAAVAQQAIVVAPRSETTRYPPGYYSYSLPRQHDPYPPHLARSPAEKRMYRKLNEWLSNPYRSPFVESQEEAVRLGLQREVLGYASQGPSEAPPPPPPHSGGIGRVGGIGKVGAPER